MSTFKTQSAMTFDQRLSRLFTERKKEIETEIIRKSIHMTAAFVPALSRFNLEITLTLLTITSLAYFFIELSRLAGRDIGIVSSVLNAAVRDENRNKMTLGPITMALGVALSLIIFPEGIADIAIYSLAFGDGFASLIGKSFGKHKLPIPGKKSLEGSAACFTAVLIASFIRTGNAGISLFLALAAMLIEALPLGEYDNLVLPLGIGFITLVLL